MVIPKLRRPVATLSRRGLLGAGVACLLGRTGWDRLGTVGSGLIVPGPSEPEMIGPDVTGSDPIAPRVVPRVVRPGTHTAGRRDWLAADRRAVVSLGGGHDRIAITFDDGPDPAYTPHVLDLLARYEVPATFFVIGRNVVAHPGLVARILSEGHVVANHTHDHLWLDSLDRAGVATQVDAGAADLAAAGAGRTGLLRVPRGWTSPTVADVALERAVRCVFWTVCLEAYLHHGPQAVALMGHRLRAGAIVLCHDGGQLDGPNPQAVDRSRTLEALPGLLRSVRGRRLRPVTLAAAGTAARSSAG